MTLDSRICSLLYLILESNETEVSLNTRCYRLQFCVDINREKKKRGALLVEITFAFFHRIRIFDKTFFGVKDREGSPPILFSLLV